MKNDQDFRTAFASMDPRAVISREELALLLCRSPAAVSLMAHRGKLPRRAFPSERKACWFVGDVRDWLCEMASSRPATSPDENAPERRAGRPRKSVD
ncbi:MULTISPECIES: helix-turn-helix transcriptional regulator [Ralstonia solanacearum species complex]|uniref:helix-turn-helix transcriptional regulator n=1 Tax=Ralstonia solanacearum species complex TaxID=3116862 RepID=UPI0010722144|nr:hypothetical protein [Ralstonia solanacearum]